MKFLFVAANIPRSSTARDKRQTKTLRRVSVRGREERKERRTGSVSCFKSGHNACTTATLKYCMKIGV